MLSAQGPVFLSPSWYSYKAGTPIKQVLWLAPGRESELRLRVMGGGGGACLRSGTGLKPSPVAPRGLLPFTSRGSVLSLHHHPLLSSLSHSLSQPPWNYLFIFASSSLFPWNDLNSLPKAAEGQGLWSQLPTAGVACSTCGQPPSQKSRDLHGVQAWKQTLQKSSAERHNICQTGSGRQDCQGLEIER